MIVGRSCNGKDDPPGTGNSNAGPAKKTKGGKAQKAKGRRGKKGGSNKKKKGKLKCGDSGKYGDLQKKYADGKERDHVLPVLPCCRTRRTLVAKTCVLLRKVPYAAPPRPALSRKGIHAQYSKTFRGRNKRSQIKSDAKNKKKAANRDTAAIKKGLRKSGASKECKKKYAAWAEKVNSKTQSWYENMIRGAINKAPQQTMKEV